MLTLVICMQDSDADRVCTPARGLPVFQPLLALLVAWSACQLYKTRHLSWLDKMRAFVLPIFYCQWWADPHADVGHHKDDGNRCPLHAIAA